MRRIKDIFSAITTIRRVLSSVAIASAWTSVRAAHADPDNESASDADLDLIDSLITAIVAIAKDDEDKAAAPGKDGK